MIDPTVPERPSPARHVWNIFKAAMIIIVIAFTGGAACGACKLGIRLVESLAP